jgi:very-short-patch-repair endonuclease
MHQPSPIVLFTYLRLETLQKTVNALAANFYALDSDLIIFSDGAKYLKDEAKVKEIRTYLKTVVGFKSLVIHESSSNKGLATSIIEGVSSILKEYPSAIVLEDDLITSTNFLAFMNQALTYYQGNPKVLSISGFSPIIKGLGENEVYFTQRSSSWGWACWADRWEQIDWACESYQEFRINSKMKSKFNAMGSDMSLMLKRQMEGKINSWAIRFCFHQFQHNLYSVHPSVSKVQNLGFDELSTNTKFYSKRFSSELDQSELQEFHFENQVYLDSKIIKQFVKDNTIVARIRYKLICLFK